MLTLESALTDTSYGLELEKIKNKIEQLYNNLLVKTYKASNPSASPEEIQQFLETNKMEFKGEGFEEEAEDLESILDQLVQTEELEEVKEKDYEKHDVQKGSKAKKVSEGRPAPKTLNIEVAQGGLFTPPDKKVKKVTKSLKTPTGKITRVIDDNPKIETKMLKEVWDEEREKLLALVRRLNKEHGIRLW